MENDNFEHDQLDMDKRDDIFQDADDYENELNEECCDPNEEHRNYGMF